MIEHVPRIWRELAMVALALVLMTWPIFQINWRHDDCHAWHWIMPLAGFVGGAAIFGYSNSYAVRGLGGLTMLFSGATAFMLLMCGVVL